MRVFEVPPDSPAERAGLKADDRLIAIDGRPVAERTSEQVQAALSGEVGSVVWLQVLRGSERLDLHVTRAPYARAGSPRVSNEGAEP